MQSRPKKYDEQKLNDYIAMVIENISLGTLTTEQKARELTVLVLTLLSVAPKTMRVGVS